MSRRDLELDAKKPTTEDSPLTRKIRQLENRLDKAMIKYNEAQSIGKTYEQIVKRLAEERVGFDNQIVAIERTVAAKGALCRCVAVSLCRCVAVSLCRCVAVSLCRCVAVSLCRCVAVSLCRCVDGSRTVVLAAECVCARVCARASVRMSVRHPVRGRCLWSPWPLCVNTRASALCMNGYASLSVCLSQSTTTRS